jgi:hypothetical protein
MLVASKLVHPRRLLMAFKVIKHVDAQQEKACFVGMESRSRAVQYVFRLRFALECPLRMHTPRVDHEQH